MNQIEETKEFIKRLPEADIYGYGSGFFKQNEGKKERDLLIFTDGINTWHNKNYQKNPEFYEDANTKELLKEENSKTFPKSVSCFFVHYKDRVYKLMVIDKDYIKKDLLEWNDFSIPARLQKPTVNLEKTSDEIDKLLEINYLNALKASLLMLPDNSKEEEIYKKIASLSYIGDIRVKFGFENKEKINNIVSGSYKFFKDTYQDKIDKVDPTKDLPLTLKDYLDKNLKEKTNKEEIKELTKKYFETKDFISSQKLALRCLQTVGINMSLKTLQRKAKLGGKTLTKTRTK